MRGTVQKGKKWYAVIYDGVNPATGNYRRRWDQAGTRRGDAEMPHLPFPHGSQVDGELRELRCHHGRKLYRVLYRRSDRHGPHRSREGRPVPVDSLLDDLWPEERPWSSP